MRGIYGVLWFALDCNIYCAENVIDTAHSPQLVYTLLC